MADIGKSRGSNWTSTELNQLCRSWCHVLQDPIVGNGQTLKSFWERIYDHYKENKPAEKPERNMRSLDSKWSELKHDIAKFSGCFQTVLDKNHSGDSLEDTLRKSKELYVVKHPKRKLFLYVDQWHLLRDCPRFSLTVDDMHQKLAQTKARKQKGKGRLNVDKENSTPNMETVIDLEANGEGAGPGTGTGQKSSSSISSDSLHFGERRPTGNKSAKKQCTEDSAAKIMAAAQRDMAIISAKRLRLADKQDLENLLTLKVADVDEECQEYFRACRAKELRIAMAKLQREEEEELSAIRRGATRSPLPFVATDSAPAIHVPYASPEPPPHRIISPERESDEEQSPGYVHPRFMNTDVDPAAARVPCDLNDFNM